MQEEGGIDIQINAGRWSDRYTYRLRKREGQIDRYMQEDRGIDRLIDAGKWRDR